MTDIKNDNNKNNIKTLVMKFGGTSVGTVEAMESAAKIVADNRKDWKNVLVVSSALSGVTNLLLDSASKASQGDTTYYAIAIGELRVKHYMILEKLVPDINIKNRVMQEINNLIADFSNLCQAIAVIGEASPRALDAVSGLGERMSVRVFAAVLESMGVDAQYVEATSLIITDDHFQNASPDMAATTIQTQKVLNELLSKGTIPIITGFISATPEGVTTTLGRGGSDFSAAIIGKSMKTDEVWIWTDVDGVMTVDPRLVKEACTIPELTYREVAELAYYGAKVLHPKTIHPVIEAGIGLRVCNTFNPDHPGTRIVANQKETSDSVIKAVSAIRGIKLITLEGRGMLGVPGVAAKTFKAVAETGTSVPLITQASSEQSICFAVPQESADKVISALEKTFAMEIARKDIDRVWATEEAVIITVVGAGMLNTPGVAGRIFSALGKVGVNVIAIAQGSSEVAISLTVAAGDLLPSVESLHELIVHGDN